MHGEHLTLSLKRTSMCSGYMIRAHHAWSQLVHGSPAISYHSVCEYTCWEFCLWVWWETFLQSVGILPFRRQDLNVMVCNTAWLSLGWKTLLKFKNQTKFLLPHITIHMNIGISPCFSILKWISAYQNLNTIPSAFYIVAKAYWEAA